MLSCIFLDVVEVIYGEIIIMWYCCCLLTQSCLTLCNPMDCSTPYMWYAATTKSLQSCLTLCDPIDGSPPGPPILGILQARTLEWVAIFFSNA